MSIPDDHVDDYILENNQTCDACYELFPNEDMQSLFDDDYNGGVLMYCPECYPKVKKIVDTEKEEELAEDIANKMMEDPEE